MLSPALLNAADRLSAILMALLEATYPIALGGSTPTFTDHAAKTLFFRLTHLVATLIRISNFGIRASAQRATTPSRIHPAPTSQRHGPAQTLPRRPGWLLAALPDIAPAIAADLAALLADPALTNFFAATPTLHRSLRPLFRSLGLTQPPPDPSPPSTQVGGCEHPTLRMVGCSHPTIPATRPPSPTPRSCPTALAVPPAASKCPTNPSPFHAHIVTT